MDPIKYSSADIQSAVFGLAGRLISTITKEDTVLYACILRGGAVFFADLIRQLPYGYTEYISASSYDDKGNRGELTIHSMPYEVGAPKYTKIFLIDDICDSGITLSLIASQLRARFPKAEVKTVTLIQKTHSPRPADYCAFQDDTDDFVYGYGMDRANGYARNEVNIRVMDRGNI